MQNLMTARYRSHDSRISIYTKLKLQMVPAFYLFSWMVPSAVQLPRGMYTRLMLSINDVCVSCWESNGTYHLVRNDDVRRKTEQPHLTTSTQARRLSLLGHNAQISNESDAKQILTASPSENWRRPPGCPDITWMKTTQQDLKSVNLSLNEAIDIDQNHPLWRMTSTFGTMHS